MDGPSSSSAGASGSSSFNPQNPLQGVVPGQVDYLQARQLMVRALPTSPPGSSLSPS